MHEMQIIIYARGVCLSVCHAHMQCVWGRLVQLLPNYFNLLLNCSNHEEILHATIVKFTTSPCLCAHLT